MRRFIVRVVSIMLALVIVSGICPVKEGVYAASDSQEIAVEAIDALHTFGFIADYYDYNADFEGNAIRADFFDVLCKILNPIAYNTNQLYYYDVPASHWAYKSISYLTEVGVISGFGNNICRPDDKLGFNEACAAALNAMGYSEYAKALGGYPAGYIKAATEIGITEDVSYSEYLTRRDMFILLYNVATTNIPEKNMLSSNNTSAKADDEDRTLLSMKHDIYYNEGIVSAANCIGLDGTILKNANDVIVGENEYVSNVGLFDYMGEEIKFYFRYDKRLDEKTVIWAKPTGKTEVLNITVNHDAIFNPESFQLKYTNDNKKTKSVNIEKGVSLIYNGGLIEENISDILSKDEYELKLVRDKSGDYSVAVVRSYFNIVAGTIANKEFTVYDKVNPGNKVNLDPDKYKFIKMTQMGEVEVGFEDIAENAVLSVYMSKDGQFVEIVKSGKTSEGVLDNIRWEAEGKYFTVDNTEYFCPDSNADDGVKVGAKVKLHLDFADKVAWAEYNETNVNAAAYMINGAINEDEGSIRIKILRENGVVENLYLAEKVKIDGIMYKDVTAIMRKLSDEDNVFKSQIMVYALNDEGKIKEIDTSDYDAYSESKTSLQIDVEYAENMRFKSSGILGPLILMDANTKIFVIPQKGNIQDVSDEDVDVIKMGDIENDQFLNAEAYALHSEGGIAKYAVIYGYNRSSYKNAVMPVLVSSVSKTINEDDELVECVKGYQANNYVELKVASGQSLEKHELVKGSLIRVGLNTKKEITDAEVLYKPGGDYKTSHADLNYNYRTVIGYANRLTDGVLYIGENSADVRTLAVKTNGVPIIMYDSHEVRGESVKNVSVDEIKTYENEPDSPSRVVIITRFMAPALIVIYN